MAAKASVTDRSLYSVPTTIPIVLFYISFVADLVGLEKANAALWGTGALFNILGMLVGLIATVPGIMDILAFAPPEGGAKKRGPWLFLMNIAALAAFAASWKWRDGMHPGSLTLLFEFFGVALISWSAWIGSYVLFNDQLAIARAPAPIVIREEVLHGSPGMWTMAAKFDELKPGYMKLLHYGERRILLGRTDRGYVAFEDSASTSEGLLVGSVATAKLEDKLSLEVDGAPDWRLLAYPLQNSTDGVRIRLPSPEKGSAPSKDAAPSPIIVPSS